MKRIVLILFILISIVTVAPKVQAQCSMCTINAEQGVKNGNTQALGLNTGVIYLLSIPYLLALVIGIIWYKKYRKKNIQVVAKNNPFI